VCQTWHYISGSAENRVSKINGLREFQAAKCRRWANVSFAAGLLRGLARLPLAADDAFACLDAPGPLAGRLPAAQRAPFLGLVDDLARARGGADETALLVRLLSIALPCCRPAAPTMPPGPPWLEALLPLLDDDRPVGDVAGLVRRAGVSHPHLARAMRRHLGLSPSGFLNRCRVNRAARLLAATDRPVGDIALAVGFNDLGYFDRCFARERGQSPGAWRRQQQRFIADPR
jgi:AraC-like DNA-binding protein